VVEVKQDKEAGISGIFYSSLSLADTLQEQKSEEDVQPSDVILLVDMDGNPNIGIS
jgi:hypothetical protein